MRFKNGFDFAQIQYFLWPIHSMLGWPDFQKNRARSKKLKPQLPMTTQRSHKKIWVPTSSHFFSRAFLNFGLALHNAKNESAQNGLKLKSSKYNSTLLIAKISNLSIFDQNWGSFFSYWAQIFCLCLGLVFPSPVTKETSSILVKNGQIWSFCNQKGWIYSEDFNFRPFWALLFSAVCSAEPIFQIHRAKFW